MEQLKKNDGYNRFTDDNFDAKRERTRRKKTNSGRMKGIGFYIFLIVVFLISYLLFANLYFV